MCTRRTLVTALAHWSEAVFCLARDVTSLILHSMVFDRYQSGVGVDGAERVL